MSFSVRDRVAILNESREVVCTGTIVNINDFREPSMKYAIDVDGYYDDYLFVGEKYLKKIDEGEWV